MNTAKHLIFRVAFESRENYRVLDQYGKTWPARISGYLRAHSEGLPTVGDWVRGEPQPGDWILIEELGVRKTELVRKDPHKGAQVLAANIDVLFIVTSANRDLNLNRLERYVLLAANGGIQPVILINKIELEGDPHSLLDGVAHRFKGVDVHGVSAHEGWNMECLYSYALPDTTVAFVGSSGVGKSSLTNLLLGHHQMEVQDIREDDSRGRHTTTHRELHVLKNGAVVIDTPGIRQVGLTDEMELGLAFDDVESLFCQCKFTDCRHDTEPGCALQTALETGSLSLERWQSYQKLQKEIDFEKRKTNKALQSEEKRKWAKIHKNNRERMRLRGK